MEIPADRPLTRLGLLLSNPLANGVAAHDADQGMGGEVEGVLSGVVDLAAAVERAGFDSLWVSDSIGTDEAEIPAVPVETGRNGLRYEAYSLLGALAVHTASLSLGALPLRADARAPSVLAKIVTTIDVLSHGRSIITLGTSPSFDRVDVQRLAEAIRVCRAVLNDVDPEFVGSFYEIHGAINRPPPVHSGGIPIAVFVNSEGPSWSDALEVAARSADAVVVGGDEAAVDRAAEFLRSIAYAEVPWSPAVPVIWSGPLLADRPQCSSELPMELLDALGEIEGRIDAGADGCIISIDSTDQLGMILEAGPMLLDALGRPRL